MGYELSYRRSRVSCASVFPVLRPPLHAKAATLTSEGIERAGCRLDHRGDRLHSPPLPL